MIRINRLKTRSKIYLSESRNKLILLLLITSFISSFYFLNKVYGESFFLKKEKKIAINKFNEAKNSGDYKKIYLIEWSKKDDRSHRREILLLISGAFSGILKQLIETGGAWFDEWMDDLGQEKKVWEESDAIAESELIELKESFKNYHPIYSYKATVNNNRKVYFIVALRKRMFLGLNKFDLIMITDRYQFLVDENFKVTVKKLRGKPKVFVYSTIISLKLEPIKSKMKELEISKNRFYFEEKK